MEIPDMQGLQAVGWQGFYDLNYLLQSLASLLLSTALGALIAFHPATRRNVDTIEEAELPKVQIMCALIGAMVGVVVLEYGLVVGFVIFGLGGLMRFRTETATTRDTSRLIIVTLIGLICGLNLPHFAVLATFYAFVVIFFFDGFPVYSVEVHELPKGRLKEAADAYRAAFAELGCKLISENKSFAKRRIDFVLRASGGNHTALQAALLDKVPAELRGELDWEIR